MISERTYAWARPLSTRRGAPKGIIVHHAAASIASAATIHGWHLNNGWSGIGYHFVIRKTGLIERGRPESATGSHAAGANDRLGICLEGDFTRETLGKLQRDALVWLLRDLTTRYGALAITGHREHGSTSCPGSIPLAAIITEARTSAAPPKEEAPVTVSPYRIVTAECPTLAVRNLVAKMCADRGMAHAVLGRCVVFHGSLDKVREVEEVIATSGAKRTHGVIVEAGTHNPLNQSPPHGRFTDAEAFGGTDTALAERHERLTRAARAAIDGLDKAL